MDLNIYCFALSAISHEKKIAKLMVVPVTNWFFASWSLVDHFYTFLLIKLFVSYLFRIEIFIDLPKIFRYTFC